MDRLGWAKKPPQYYKVVFYEADCLRMEAEAAQKKGDKPKAAEAAKKGEELLKFCLFNKPKLDGPDTVAMYNTLLDQLARLQGRTPAAKTAGK